MTNTGARYNPVSDDWFITSTGANCPSERQNHAAVWTGTEMIIWGGDSFLYTGGRYNPTSDTWLPTSTGTNCPGGLWGFSSVWTGQEMIIWGGSQGMVTSQGWRYDPHSDAWHLTDSGGNCPSARSKHVSVWTGMEMIIWGGSSGGSINSGGRYAPDTDTWLPMAPGTVYATAGYWTKAIWTGMEMIVWSSGWEGGGRFLPALDAWLPISTGEGCPPPLEGCSSIWTGSEMIVWGGRDYFDYYNVGGRYNPATDFWISTSTGANCPSGRWGHTAIWTGASMIIWGGNDDANSLRTGGRYHTETNTWLPTASTGNCPAARTGHQAIWTGARMVVWGGLSGSSLVNTGGIYNATRDTWTATSIASGCPSPRQQFTSVWTGEEMIVWGGSGMEGTIGNGGRYKPSTDTWIPIPSGDQGPAPRKSHSAVWSGTTMIIWGGDHFVSPNYLQLNTGGQYYPPTDSWIPIHSATSPTERSYHVAVWTGESMIVWGGRQSAHFHNNGGIFTPTQMIVPDIDGPDNGCDQVLLSYPIYSAYQWSLNGYPINGATGQTCTATQSGIYSVTVIDTRGCTGTSPGKLVSVSPSPSPMVTGPATNTCPATTVTLSTGTYTGYQWLCGGTEIASATNQSYKVSLSGQYRVRATDANGCNGLSSGKMVTITFCPTSEVSPNGAVFHFRLTKDPSSPTGYYLYFQKMNGATGYALYRGTIGTWYSHGGSAGRICNPTTSDLSTGEMRASFVPSSGNHYYLITAHSTAIEGPSGYDSNGNKIPDSLNTCPP